MSTDTTADVEGTQFMTFHDLAYDAGKTDFHRKAQPVGQGREGGWGTADVREASSRACQRLPLSSCLTCSGMRHHHAQHHAGCRVYDAQSMTRCTHVSSGSKAAAYFSEIVPSLCIFAAELEANAAKRGGGGGVFPWWQRCPLA